MSLSSSIDDRINGERESSLVDHENNQRRIFVTAGQRSEILANSSTFTKNMISINELDLSNTSNNFRSFSKDT